MFKTEFISKRASVVHQIKHSTMKMLDAADAISDGCQQSVTMDVIKYN
jgi:hypothetical protein